MSRQALVPILVLIWTAALAAVFFLSGPDPVEFTKVKSAFTPSEQVFVDRDGQLLFEQRADKRVRRLNWTPLSEVPRRLQTLVIEAEDRRFYRHLGVDPLAFAQSLWEFVKTGRLRGASTITMQVGDLLVSPTRGARSFGQKLEQIRRALWLERQWSKAEIFEAYLNLVYFRGELQGVAAASQGLFGKESFGLTDAESAVLGALIRAPNADAAKVAERACQQLRRLSQPCAPAELSQNLKQIYRIAPLERLAPHLGRHFSGRGSMGRIKTSLRRGLQTQVSEILRRQVGRWSEQNLTDAAAVVLDNATGEVLAYVGNIGEASQARHVDAALALRQAGSTLKPFVYGLALERRLITTATMIPDTPTDVAVSSGVYRPSNFDRLFRGRVSARVALAGSLNIPAVRVLEAVGVEAAVDLLQVLGLSELKRADFYGPSLVLGSVDVKLLELTNAYRALANQGQWSPWSFEIRSTPPEFKAVFSKPTAFLIGHILSDRGSRGATFGWENPLATRFWSAVKTGTSKDMRDNWCIGYSSRYTVGVWAGNLSGSSMWNVSGVQGAAPAWLEIMTALHGRESSNEPHPPVGVVQKTIRLGPTASPFSEWFLVGTEPPTEVIGLTPFEQSKLIYPVDQMLIALDPDIPKTHQRLFFSVQEPKPGFVVRLNGATLAKAQTSIPWQPQLGRHHLELVNSLGQVVDQVSFQVR